MIWHKKPDITTPENPQQATELQLKPLLQLREQARQLTLGQNKAVMRLMSGSFRSGLRGRGMEFLETRHYLAGDDPRAIDWRVTARTGHAHTKVFQEERERPILFLLDYHPSLFFASKVAFKSILASRLTALLAWAAAGQGNRVGGLITAPHGHQEIRPAAGKRGVLNWIQAMLKNYEMAAKFPNQPHNPDYFDHSLKQLRRVSHTGSLICICSDFWHLGEKGHKYLQQLAQHNDLLACFVYDELEQQLPPPGIYPVSDGEQRLQLNSADPQLCSAYQARFQNHQALLKKQFNQRGMRFVPFSTAMDLSESLQQGLR